MDGQHPPLLQRGQDNQIPRPPAPPPMIAFGFHGSGSQNPTTQNLLIPGQPSNAFLPFPLPAPYPTLPPMQHQQLSYQQCAYQQLTPHPYNRPHPNSSFPLAAGSYGSQDYGTLLLPPAQLQPHQILTQLGHQQPAPSEQQSQQAVIPALAHQLAQPPPSHGYSLAHRNNKRGLDDGVMEAQSKKIKRTLQVPVNLIQLLDFLKTNPITKEFKFEAGAIVGNIDGDLTVHCPNPIGSSLVDGYFEELAIAHTENRSWGGTFEEEDMFVAEQEPLRCTIFKKPLLPATPENIHRDYLQLVKNLLYRFDGDDGRRPPYMNDLITRILDLTSHEDIYFERCLWVINNHPFLVDPAKRRGFFEDFYKFYKTMDQEQRCNFINATNVNICEDLFSNVIETDGFLSKIYWGGKSHHRDGEEEDGEAGETNGDDGRDLPYTDEDMYVAIFLRHFIVHGPEDSKVGDERINISLLELDLIIAHYFEVFLPAFLEHLFEKIHDYPLLMECLMTYTTRTRSLSMSLMSDRDGLTL